MRSFYGGGKHEIWLWRAVGRETNAPLAFAFGTRKDKYLKELLALPKPFSIEKAYADGNFPYDDNIPEDRLAVLRVTAHECQHSGLEGLSAPEFLNLGENNETSVTEISGLSALRSLRALRWLDFSQNNAPDIVGYVQDLTKLEYLRLNQNKIADVSALANLSKLRELELFYNQITDIAPLFGLSALETLNVQQNKIRALTGIYTENGSGERELVWPIMKKLDTSQNWGVNEGVNRMWRSEKLKFLRSLSQERRLEWSYNYDPEKEGLPHTDPDSGVKYVTYSNPENSY